MIAAGRSGAVVMCAWVLACVIVAAAVTTADAALTDSEQATISGLVEKEIHLIPDCVGPALNLGRLVPGDPMKETTACEMTFGTVNWRYGADLFVSDAGSPSADAMVCVTAPCGSSTLPDFEGVNPLITMTGSSLFSARLFSAGDDVPPGSTFTDWVVSAGDTGTGQYFDIPDTPEIACHTESQQDGSCSFRFAAQASGTQPPGNYEAQVLFEVYAR